LILDFGFWTLDSKSPINQESLLHLWSGFVSIREIRRQNPLNSFGASKGKGFVEPGVRPQNRVALLKGKALRLLLRKGKSGGNNAFVAGQFFADGGAQDLPAGR
jgi:hypothetical protein